MVEWMVDMFERTNNTSIIAYHIRAGGLLGIVRDGGVLMGTDSDVDVSIDPLAYEQLPVSMKVARRPKWLIFRKPEDHTLGAPSKHRWVVHFPAWPSFATFHDADTHLELYCTCSHAGRVALWAGGCHYQANRRWWRCVTESRRWGIGADGCV